MMVKLSALHVGCTLLSRNFFHVSVLISVIAKLEKYKSSGSDQLLAELIQAQGVTLVSVIHKFHLE
jgi:hypothetical protein